MAARLFRQHGSDADSMSDAGDRGRRMNHCSPRRPGESCTLSGSRDYTFREAGMGRLSGKERPLNRETALALSPNLHEKSWKVGSSGNLPGGDSS